MVIRPETPGDFERIGAVVRAAFDSAEHADGNEADLVAALRASDAYLPELALVAEIEGEVVGHILFTQIRIGQSCQLALAPLSVLPAHQRRGIGTALVRAGHQRARRMGYAYSVVLGSERYYPRFGYRPAREYGIFPPFDVPDENFMACKLTQDARPVSGKVRYAREFGIDGAQKDTEE